MKSSLVFVAAALGILALGGATAARIAAPLHERLRQREKAWPQSHDRAGSEHALALLGGFRALVADALWVRAHARWERRDWSATDAAIRAVSAIDPQRVYFWQNGARIIAYDFPLWRIGIQGGFAAVSAEEQERIAREQARLAVAHLQRALGFHPRRAELWVERGNIEYGRLRDFAAAAESYRRAAEQEHAPAYAARLHAEMLRRSGRPQEALAWLVKLHPTLRPDDDAAAADVVLSRIRELEQELGVPAAKAYRAPE